MKLHIWRTIAAVAILVITIGAFMHYFAQHPAVRRQLQDTPTLTLLAIMLLYIGFVGCLALINSATLRLCKVRMQRQESLLLTIYSSVINFFGPLQSGPAFRALYVKKKHGVKLTNYTTATVVYYLLYAFFSGLFLLSGILGWWLVLLVGLIILLVIAAYKSHDPRLQRFRQLNLSAWYLLAGATLLQVSLLAAIYYLELHSVLPHVGLQQVIVYTGAANFALFVSITPGAIGFRESFLVFSEKLHHIGNGTIVIANTIDRAMYITLLLLLVIFMFGSHAVQRLDTASLKE